MRRLIFLVATFAMILPSIIRAQEKPLPKPVTPPLPLPGAPATPPAQNPPPKRGNSAVADSTLAPFLDSETLAVVRIDLKDIELKALEDWMVKSVENLRKTEKEVVRAQDDVRQEFDVARSQVEKFRSAGGNQLYVIVGMAEMSNDQPPIFVVPVDKNTDVKSIGSLFQVKDINDAAPPSQRDIVAKRIGSALVMASPASIKRLSTPKEPAGLPDLARAFDVGTGPVRLALVPQEGARKILEALAPNLPQELGGGTIQTLSRGVQWASLSIDLPPTPSLKFLIEAADPAAAGKLKELANKAIDWAGNRKEGPRDQMAFVHLLAELKPRVEGNRLIIELKEAQTSDLAAATAAGFLGGRQQATRVLAASNLRQLAMGIFMYATDHEGKLPKNLGQEINTYLGGSFKQLWIDPLRPNQEKPYVYLRLGDKQSAIQKPDQAVMIYENHSTWDDGINVAFADGHVEWIADEKRFKQMLDQTKKDNPQAVEMPQ